MKDTVLPSPEDQEGRVEEFYITSIEGVLADNLDLDRLPLFLSVCCLGSGNSRECIAVRRLLPHSSIYAFDRELPDSQEERRQNIARTKFRCLNVYNIGRILSEMGVNGCPDLVLCRHPKIANIINGEIVPDNDAPVWVASLVNWGIRVSAYNSQMLITTFTREDRDILGLAMKEAGLNPILGENPNGIVPPNRDWQELGVKIDGYTLRL